MIESNSCIHVWEFFDNASEPEFDSYFRCEKCHKLAPYCPDELADIAEEMGNENDL